MQLLRMLQDRHWQDDIHERNSLNEYDTDNANEKGSKERTKYSEHKITNTMTMIQENQLDSVSNIYFSKQN